MSVKPRRRWRPGYVIAVDTRGDIPGNQLYLICTDRYRLSSKRSESIWINPERAGRAIIEAKREDFFARWGFTIEGV